MQASISIFVLSIFLFFRSVSDDIPDYSKLDYWAAHPDKRDFADFTPSKTNWEDQQAESKADVFFIHPTTFYRRYRSNGPLTDRAVNRFTDKHSIRMQASVFNGSAKVYAPRYRQAALFNYFKKESDKSQAAFDLAYSDVKAAFEYYLEYANKGRPIIIAGHSQGSMHGQRLLSEFFDGKNLQDQLVAAYLIGYNIAATSFQSVPICRDPNDVGCVLSYNSYGRGSKAKLNKYNAAICVNPVSWKSDNTFVHATDHPGGVGRDFKDIDEHLVSCQCSEGVLWIEGLKKNNYPTLANKNYHLSEYLLFYGSIRANVKERLSGFLMPKG